VRPLVAFDEPLLGDLLGLRAGVEDAGIEHLASAPPVEAFDERVLVGLAGADEAQRDLAFSEPIEERRGGQLAAVVQP